ncbi:DUF2339 domain-containing protein [Sutcliffiella deserti]|uniref:DUF2339 domain-containing protein n=1 Tax=Sutcliffiella deserti TaxID=2875501 RepID=UPI001CBFBA40|nr:DUF2339 domain-containing protein [Sutcliffiella deserti]
MDHESKIKSLENRVHHLENEISRLHELVTEIKTGSNRSAGWEKPVERTEKVNKTIFKPMREIQPSPTAETTDWEKILLQTWLPRVFILVLIVGVLWGFKAASDYGWLNSSVKVGLGYLTACMLLYAGYKQMHKKREVLGQVLLGGAISILMLTTFAMHILYGMVGPTFAFILQVIWIIFGVWLTVRFKTQVLAMISVLAGFLVPFLIENTNPSIFIFIGYETILFVVFLYLAIQLSFPILYVSSYILLNGTLMVYYGFSPDIEQAFLLATAIIIQHAVLLYFFLTTDFFWKVQAVTLFSSALITYWWVSLIYQDLSITLFLLLGIGTYIALSYLWKDDKKRVDVLATNGLVFLFFFFFHFINEEIVAGLLLLQGVAAFYVAVKYNSLINKILAVFIYFVGTVMVLFSFIETPLSIETLQWMILLVTLSLGIWINWKNNQESKGKVLTIGSIAFTAFTLIFVSQFTLAITKDFDYETRTLWLSFAWIAQAVLTIIVGLWLKFKQAKYIGVGLLVLTLVKLVLLDLPFIPIQFRALLFIVLGIIGLIVSRTFYQKNK